MWDLAGQWERTMSNESHEYSYSGAGKWSESEKSPNQNQQRTKNWRIIKIPHFVRLTYTLSFHNHFSKIYYLFELKTSFLSAHFCANYGENIIMVLWRVYFLSSPITRNLYIAKYLLPDTVENNIYIRYTAWIETSIIQNITHYIQFSAHVN